MVLALTAFGAAKERNAPPLSTPVWIYERDGAKVAMATTNTLAAAVHLRFLREPLPGWLKGS